MFNYFEIFFCAFILTNVWLWPTQGQPDATFTPENMEKLLEMRKVNIKDAVLNCHVKSVNLQIRLS